MIREIILSIPDRKRQLCLLAAATVAGVLLFYRQVDSWPACFLIAGGGAVVILLFTKEKKEAAVSMSLVAVLFLITFFHCMYDNRCYERHLGLVSEQTECTVTGKLYKKEMKKNQYLYYLKGTKYGKILVYTADDSAKIGSVVTASGEADLFPTARNDGNFDQAAYYRSMNIVCRIFADTVWCEKEGPANFREALFLLQRRLSNVYESELNERDAGILCTLALGNKALLENEVRELYQDAGISHILAISGLHLSILGMGLFRFLRKFHCPYPFAACAGSAAVIIFALMSGMAVSVRRALIMYLLVMGAKLFGRAYDGVNALALAVVINLCIQPLALYQSGFQFSCVSLVGIQFSVSFLNAKQRERVERKTENAIREKHQSKNSVYKKVSEFFSGIQIRLFSGIILQLFLLPLIAMHDYEVPLYSIFLNLLVLPLCSWLLGFGLLGGIAGLAFPGLSKWLLVVCHLILSFYDRLIGAANGLPFSRIITGKPNAWLMLLYYIALVGFFLAAISAMDGTKEVSKVPNKFMLGATIGILSILLFLPKSSLMRIDFLDVSQGDGIYLSDGNGHHIMIDGGSTDEDEVGRYRIEPFLKYHGVKKIDAWIITHSDADHCSGALELLENGYPVKRLLLAEAIPADDTARSLVEAAEKNHTELVWVNSGDALNLSECSMTCLYPDASLDTADGNSMTLKKSLQDSTETTAEDSDADGNALSQVWMFKQEDFSILFTGDIGADTEKLLLERKVLQNCSVLKVAHHGSKNSSSEDFLETVFPEYAVISSGQGNSYGHPHIDTLKRLGAAKSEIRNTQDCGQITFLYKGGKWRLKTHL